MEARSGPAGRHLGRPGGYRAFVPAPLPPDIALTPSLLRSLSDDARSHAERINALLAQWRHSLAGAASQTPVQLIDLLAENPCWTIPRIAQRLDVAFTTARRAVAKLEAHGMLTQTVGRQRRRVYCATALIAILDEPARLQPGDPG